LKIIDVEIINGNPEMLHTSNAIQCGGMATRLQPQERVTNGGQTQMDPNTHARDDGLHGGFGAEFGNRFLLSQLLSKNPLICHAIKTMTCGRAAT
jgi:hypothetical protein